MRVARLRCTVAAMLLAGAGMLAPAARAAPADPCDPLAHGATGDGRTDNTQALQAAIDACSVDGGGLVTLSGGVFVSGPILLKNHVLLNIEKGATLRAIGDHARYDPAAIGSPYHADEALIAAYGARDVGIIGQGTIDGQGAPWWAATLLARRNDPAGSGPPRPWLIEFYQSRSVVLEGVSVIDAPMRSVVARYSDGVFINEVTVSNPAASPDTDGIDVVSSRNVRISRIAIDTGADCIALESGLPSYAMPAVPTTNVRIFDATLSACRGLSIGTETANGIQHVQVRNVSFNGTSNGLRIGSGRDRGNEISDIAYRHIRMTDVGTVLSFSADPARPGTAQPITAATPFIHNILVDDLQATGAAAAGLVAGLPESPIYNLTLRNVSIAAATGLALRDVSLRAEQLAVPIVPQENVQIVGRVNSAGISGP